MQKWLSKYMLLVLAGCLWSISLLAQPMNNNDLKMIKEADFENERFHEREVTFLLSDKPNVSPTVRYNPLILVLGGLMYGYQKVISPQISSKCSFEPTCSRFSVAAIKKYGIIKGLALSADRLCRCSPIAARDISFINVDRRRRKVVNKPEKYQLKSVD